MRYFDVQDMPLRNHIMIVRGTQPQLAEIDRNVDALRRSLREAGALNHVQDLFTPVGQPVPTFEMVVQIHAVSDLLEGRSSNHLRDLVFADIGPLTDTRIEIRPQGQNWVVKAADDDQELVDQALCKLRAN